MSPSESYSAKIRLGILSAPSGTIQGFVIQKNGVLRIKPLKFKRKVKRNSK
jgi:hypothetical protein